MPPAAESLLRVASVTRRYVASAAQLTAAHNPSETTQLTWLR